MSVTVTRNGAETAAGVEYGTDTNYGSSVSVIDDPGSTEGSYTIQVVLGGLTANTLYHYRAVASNSAGTAFGEDRTFVAGNNSPVAQDDELTLPAGAGPFHCRFLQTIRIRKAIHFASPLSRSLPAARSPSRTTARIFHIW